MVRQDLDFGQLLIVTIALKLILFFRLRVVFLAHRMVLLVVLEARIDVGTIAFRSSLFLETTVNELLFAQVGQDSASNLVGALKSIICHVSPR